MEELTNFDQLLEEFLNRKITYSAEFNPQTGKVKRLGPSEVFDLESSNVIVVENSLAEQVLSGEIPLGSCFVDTVNESFEIVETKSLNKIDDVLHRIMNIVWSDNNKPDVYITYKNSTIIIELSEELGGSHTLAEEFQPVKSRKVFWSGDTTMSFLLTDYNDPHIIHREFKFQLQDLLNGPAIFKDVEFTEKHSLYTRRLFKNYIMETK